MNLGGRLGGVEDEPAVAGLAVDGTVVGSGAVGGVVREDDRDRAVALRVRHLVVIGRVVTAACPVGVDLSDASQAVLAKMGAGLAHGLGGDVVVAGGEVEHWGL